MSVQADSTNISNPSEQLKDAMWVKKLTFKALTQLVNETGVALSESDVQNVIYGRSKKKDKIQAIASVLGVTLNARSERSKFVESADAQVPYDGKIYRKVVILVDKVLSEMAIENTKSVLEEYTDTVYRYVMLENKLEVGEKVEGFLEGIINRDISNGRFLKRG